MTDLVEFLPQLDVGIRDGLNEPALGLKLNGSIATITYLHMVGELAYPVYEFINLFIRPLLDIFKLIYSNSGKCHHPRYSPDNQGNSPGLICGLHHVGPNGP